MLSPDLTAQRQRISRQVALDTLDCLRIGDLWRDHQLEHRFPNDYAAVMH